MVIKWDGADNYSMMVRNLYESHLNGTIERLEDVVFQLALIEYEETGVMDHFKIACNAYEYDQMCKKLNSMIESGTSDWLVSKYHSDLMQIEEARKVIMEQQRKQARWAMNAARGELFDNDELEEKYAHK